jgi:hypothetical protein
MSNISKYWLTTSAFAVVLTLSGCIVDPNHSAGGGYNNATNSTTDLHARLVYDLSKKNIRYAENQMRDRGYTEYGRDGVFSWWYNEQANVCYQLEEDNGLVKKVHGKFPSDCQKAPQSSNRGYQENRNTSRSSHQVGDVPNALSDMVGARAGQADDELARRGYQFDHNQNSGNDIYGYYRETATGECVVIKTSDGRFQSIVYGTRSCN